MFPVDHEAEGLGREGGRARSALKIASRTPSVLPITLLFLSGRPPPVPSAAMLSCHACRHRGTRLPPSRQR